MYHLPTQVYGLIHAHHPEEFVSAGDFLVYKFPVWAWCAFIFFLKRSVSELSYPGKLEIGPRSVTFFLRTNSTLLRGVYLVYDAQPHLHTRTLTRTLNGSSPLLMLPVLPLLAMAMNGLRHTQAESLRSSLCRIRVKFEISQI